MSEPAARTDTQPFALEPLAPSTSPNAVRKPRRAAANRPRAQAAATAHAGADPTDRTMANWQPLAGSADADLLPDLGTLVSRSRDLARNNGIASGAIQTLKDNIVGSVLRLSSQPDYRLLGRDKAWADEWGNNTEAQFRSWAETTECDAGRTMTLLGLTTQALGAALLNGEALAIPYWLPRPMSRWATRLLLIEADRLATPPGMENRPNIRGGVEVDEYGAPVAYWIQASHPGDRFGFRFPSAADFERIEAFTPWGRRRVLHLHDKERTGQSRGKPIVTAVMREFQMAGKYSTTELQAAVANSLIAAFLESDFSSEMTAELLGATPGEAWNQKMSEFRAPLKGGAVIPLPLGTKLSSFTPGRPNTAFDAFMHAVLRHIAAGLNIPYELLTKDFTRTNYSSARAALLEAWRYFLGRRRWLGEYWLNPIEELWMEEAVNLGRIEAPDWYEYRYAYLRCRWIHAGRGWVDPQREANAAVTRVTNSLSTLEAECAEQGLDWEEVIHQRAREKQLMDDLKLDSTAIFGPDGGTPDHNTASQAPA